MASNGPVLQLGSRDVIQTDHSRAWDRNRARVVTSNRPVLKLGVATAVTLSTPVLALGVGSGL